MRHHIDRPTAMTNPQHGTGNHRISVPLPDVRNLPQPTICRLRLAHYFLPTDILPNGEPRPSYVVGEAALVLEDVYHILARVVRPDSGPKLLEILDIYDVVRGRAESLDFDMSLMGDAYGLMAPAHVAEKSRRYAHCAAGRN